MRLIHSTTLKLHEFIGRQIPQYAILSHTWGDEEVSFQELQNNVPEVREKKGFDKIRQCCRIAAEDGFEYAWVDTCCIDKTSSAELSEAINSMFRLYQRAEVCYAFLADVPSDEDLQKEGSAFRKSRWFTRGWTLQELIAPAHVTFLGSNWEDIGSKLSLLKLVSEITKIRQGALDGSQELTYWNAAQKMSWASNRVTTREEDTAYCLMGIFDINMPMLYGEGEKAFMRLQEEIIKSSQDESIFAWWNNNEDLRKLNQYNRGLLASGPHQFASSGDIRNIREEDSLGSRQSFTSICDFIELHFPIIDLDGFVKKRSYWDEYWHISDPVDSLDKKHKKGTYLAILSCLDEQYPSERLALCLTWSGRGDSFRRIQTDLRHHVAMNDPRVDTIPRPICVRKVQMYSEPYPRFESAAFWVTVEDFSKRQLKIEPFRNPYIFLHRGIEEEGQILGEVTQHSSIFGFRVFYTMDLHFLIMIKLVKTKTAYDFAQAVEVIHENNPVGMTSLRGIIDAFKSSSEHTDRIVRDIPSLGVVTVKIKKLGRARSLPSWIQGSYDRSNIKLFYLRHGNLVEHPVTGFDLEEQASRRYLIDVDLR